jgi:DNA-binding transcriptional LysR family regulator
VTNKDTPELTLRGLRAFVVVEETGSISDGAKRIGGSTSGVSQQITALEGAVGAKLFDRQSRPLRLTPVGQMLRAHAHKILKTVSDAQAELSEHNLVDLPKLTLAIIDDLDTSLTPVLVANLQRRFRGCFVNAYSGRSDHMMEMLQNRDVDICVSALLPEDTNTFRSIPILREPFILVTAKGLLRKDQDTLEQLSNAPFIPYSDAIPIGRTITQHLRRVRFDTPRRLAFEASRSVIAMVVQDKGWTITSPLNLLDGERFFPQIDVLQVPFPAFSREVYLIARTTELGDLPDRLAEDCRQLIESQVSPRFAGFVPHMADAIEAITI